MKKYLLVFSFFIVVTYGQSDIESFPDDLNFQPFIANTFEPKLGFLFQTGGNELRLDIGNSIDFLRKKINDKTTLGMGADLFTYTLLRGENDFHFPVDAVDYLFGLNFTYKQKLDESEIGGRLRISHISAHFVDGHFDGTSGEWRDGHEPHVYSREFIEVLGYYRLNDFRFYGGLAYLFHVDPDDLGKDYYEVGVEYMNDGLVFDYASFFAGYDLRLTNLYEYTANHNICIGIKFGHPEGKGFSIYYNYFKGNSIHGEYYDSEKEYSAIGINLDL